MRSVYSVWFKCDGVRFFIVRTDKNAKVIGLIDDYPKRIGIVLEVDPLYPYHQTVTEYKELRILKAVEMELVPEDAVYIGSTREPAHYYYI